VVSESCDVTAVDGAVAAAAARQNVHYLQIASTTWNATQTPFNNDMIRVAVAHQRTFLLMRVTERVCMLTRLFTAYNKPQRTPE
jgi:hypothetical protein